MVVGGELDCSCFVIPFKEGIEKVVDGCFGIEGIYKNAVVSFGKNDAVGFNGVYKELVVNSILCINFFFLNLKQFNCTQLKSSAVAVAGVNSQSFESASPKTAS